MWRPYEDYRGLNAVTTPDRYLLLPHIHDLANHLHGKHVFTTLLVKAYHQVAVLEEDIPKSAVSTPFDLFEFVTMPFGLRNATQAIHESVLQKLECYFIYVDDVLVTSTDEEQHKKDLRLLATSGGRHNDQPS